MIPIPDTAIALVYDLEKGGPEHFIFTDRKGRIIGYYELTGIDTSGNQ